MTEHEWMACDAPVRMLLLLADHSLHGRLQRIALALADGWEAAGVLRNDVRHNVSTWRRRWEVRDFSEALSHASFAIGWDAYARFGAIFHTQAALIREVAGNPFRPVTLPRVLPVPIAKLADTVRHYAPTWAAGAAEEFGSYPWLTPTVLSLAEASYEERGRRKCPGGCIKLRGREEYVTYDSGGPDSGWFRCETCHGTGTVADRTLNNQRLLVLSDALEEAGCDSEELLLHLRGRRKCMKCGGSGKDFVPYGGGTYAAKCMRCGPPGPDELGTGLEPAPGPHVRGCWAIDCVLGKE